MGTIFELGVLALIAFLIAQDAKKNNMNPILWGILAFFPIIGVPCYFGKKWLNRAEMVSDSLFEKRRIQVFQISLALAIIGLLMIILSTGLDANGSRDERQSKGLLILLGLLLSIPSVVFAIISYFMKKDLVETNKISNTSSAPQDVQNLSFCHSCGKELKNSGDKFCSYCGSKLY